jgi:type III secretory pathway component EscV
MKKIPIFITQSRELFKILEEQFIYIEIDRDTNSIIYASGINNEIIYMNNNKKKYNSQNIEIEINEKKNE